MHKAHCSPPVRHIFHNLTPNHRGTAYSKRLGLKQTASIYLYVLVISRFQTSCKINFNATVFEYSWCSCTWSFQCLWLFFNKKPFLCARITEFESIWKENEFKSITRICRVSFNFYNDQTWLVRSWLCGCTERERLLLHTAAPGVTAVASSASLGFPALRPGALVLFAAAFRSSC